jgi:hypothetical protein
MRRPTPVAADGEKAMSLAARARTLAFGIARNRPRTLAATYEKQHGLENREYRIIVLSSSERALGEVAQQAGKPRLGGEEVRLIDVPASEPDSQGIFDGKIKAEDEKALLATTKALVEELSGASQKYQGHALPAFLTKLMTDKNWERTVRSYKDGFEAQVNAPGLKAVYRIRSNFAIIWAAAALAIDSGSLAAAVAMAVNLSVQSRPVRVFSETLPSSTRIWMRYPSNFISCSQPSAEGERDVDLQS